VIIAGKSAIRLLSDTWKTTLGEARIEHVVHPFGGECSHAEIERAKKIAGQHKARAIVGAGGGKVLDTARAVAADLDLPVVNCPTVASSDAPCSALSVIYTEDGVFQEYRFYRKNPDLVLVDTQVIAQGPPRLLAAGMGDALATWFEAKTCVEGCVRNMRGGGSSQSALALAKLCYETLLNDGAEALRAVQTQVVTPALERLVEANTLLSGLGFESSGLAAAHAIHNGLTAAPATPDYCPRREDFLRSARATGPRRAAPFGAGTGAVFFHRGRPAHHAGRDRFARTAQGIAPAGSESKRAVRGPPRHGCRCDPCRRCNRPGVEETHS
jgi:glycerol dehydrogenase